MKLADEIRALKVYDEHYTDYRYNEAIDDVLDLVEKHESERLDWTKALPTVEGWYWTRICKNIDIDRVYQGPGHLSCNGSALTCMSDFEWAGPINQPERE